MEQEAGAGGNWPRAGEKLDTTVVCQYQRQACGPASAQMLLAGWGVQVEQQVIAEACGTPVWVALLARVMRELGAESGYWEGGKPYIEGHTHDQMLDTLCASGRWAAVLWETGNRIGHVVVVDGLSGDGRRLRILDPWPPGTTYTMSRADFLNYWNEEAIWRRG